MDIDDLVDAAYEAALRDDIQTAHGHVARIAFGGGYALHHAMKGWVDRTLRVLGAGQHRKLYGFTLEYDGTGEVQDIDQVPREAAWAGRMYAARAAGDHETWHALLKAVPEDPGGITRHVMALLTIMAKSAAAAEEDTQQPRRTGGGLRRWVDEDPAATDARRAVAAQN